MHGLPGMKRRLGSFLLAMSATMVVFGLIACGNRAAPAQSITNDPGDPAAAVAPATPLSHTLDVPAADATAPAPGPR